MKLISIVLICLTISCSIMVSVTAQAQTTLSLTEDTFIEGDVDAFIIKTNSYNLRATGNITTSAFVILNGGGEIKADYIFIGSSVFFQDGNGFLTARKGINIGLDITGTGTVTYCEFLNSPLIQPNVTVIQDCTLNVPYFDFVKDAGIIGLPYEVINITGQIISKGFIDASTKNLRSTDQLYFLCVKGYQAKKMPFKN